MTRRRLPLAFTVSGAMLALAACSSPAAVSVSSSTPPAASSAGASANVTSASPAPTTPSATAPVTTPPAVGTTLLQTQLQGAVNVISNGVGFTVVQDLENPNSLQQLGAITAYDAAGNAEAKITGADNACGAADVVLPSGRRVLLAETSTSTPAQGVNPATSTTTLNEYDALTGDKLWSTTLLSGSTADDQSDDACNSSETEGQLEGFTTTSGGAYAVDQVAPNGEAWVINLTNGSKRSSTTAMQALGGVVVDETEQTDSNGDTTATFLSFSDPATGSRVGAPTGVDTDSDLNNGAIYATDSELVYTREPGGGEEDMQALAMPSGAQQWVVKNPAIDVSDVSVLGSVVIGWNHFEDSTGVAGFSLSSGAHLWTQTNAQFCAAANGKVLIAVNGQLAILSAATGKQLSFDASTGDCPNVLPNGVRWSYDGNGELTVDQYL
jgi:hypothetical protein